MRLTLLAGVLAMTTLSPATAEEPAKKAERLFEMRTYYPAEGKMDALLARFRDHTVKLFEKHGMINVGYWVEKKDGKEKLVYIVSHASKAAADESWKAFRTDPVWTKARDASEVGGKLVDKIEVVWMSPTDFSAIK